MDGQQHVGVLTLNPTTANAYTITTGTTGSVLYLDNGASSAQINNTAQNNVLSANDHPAQQQHQYHRGGRART